mmetsp:Transcript_8728/g.14812  ORF Transcript_8728/g.14812 Transcript_8728/m.14812 type:complete len:93 (-) Transcript_8728:566-844(-)
MLFFILVHIPLSRLHSGYSFLTALMPMMFNLKAKYWFYERANALVVALFKNDKEARNFVQKSRELNYEDQLSKTNIEDSPNDIFLSKDEQDQ